MKIQELLAQPNLLPAMPRVVQELISSFNDEKVSADEVARKLAADPVLSAKLLRMSNSAYFSVSRSVTTVNDAVIMLGFAAVRTLVISSGLQGGFKSVPGLDLQQFWNYCLDTAVVAKWLARQLKEDAELAFTIGMVHAIGQLIIHAGMPEKARELDREINPLETRRFDYERVSLGFNYAEASAALAAKWNFPGAFSAVIRAFPKPLEHEPFIPMSGILHLGSWHARSNALGFDAQELYSVYPLDVSARLGLEPYVMLEKMPSLPELASGLEELIA